MTMGHSACIARPGDAYDDSKCRRMGQEDRHSEPTLSSTALQSSTVPYDYEVVFVL